MAFHLKSDRHETENKTIRFPISLIEEIENVIQGNNITFSSFVIQACEYALNDLVTETNEAYKKEDNKR